MCAMTIKLSTNLSVCKVSADTLTLSPLQQVLLQDCHPCLSRTAKTRSHVARRHSTGPLECGVSGENGPWATPRCPVLEMFRFITFSNAIHYS